MFILLVFFPVVGNTQTSEYASIIKTANTYFEGKDYINAKAYYQYATNLNDSDNFAKERLTESIKLLRAQSVERNEYSQILIAADQYYKKGEFQLSIDEYAKASTLFPSEAYPLTQIDIITNLKSEQQKLIKEFEKFVLAGDNFLTEKNYEDAKIEYQFALSLIPGQEYPKEQIEIVNKLIADQSTKRRIYLEAVINGDIEFSRQRYTEAKIAFKKALDLFPKEEYPQQQLAGIEPLLSAQDRYSSLIDQADSSYIVLDFDNAATAYQEAISLKPNETYARDMLERVVATVANKEISDQEDYDNAITQGDQNFDDKEYLAAKGQYEFANRIKPVENYPKEKLDELIIIIAQLEEEEAIQTQYDQLIANADLFLAELDYNEAKSAFNDAVILLPNEQYPVTKINEIDALLLQFKEQERLDEHYRRLLVSADQLFEEDNYEMAKAEYQNALDLKPDEEYPISKIEELAVIINRIETERSLEENYSRAIELADNYLKQQKHKNAQTAYQSALNYKANEQYPKDRLLEIGNIFAEQRAELQRAYEQSISDAQNSLAIGNLLAAKQSFEEALRLKPGENYPGQEINQIDEQLAENRRNALAKYNPLIKEADEYFNIKAYDRAISTYMQASALIPHEEYPKSKIAEITELIEAASYAVLLDQPLSVEVNKLHKLQFDPLPVSERKTNYIFLKLNNVNAAQNLRIILNYGKDDVKNGGIIIRLSAEENLNEYLVRIGTQYKWFSEDNNWLTIQSEGGEVEVSRISISKII
ncbi:MAG: hypothetical protein GY834_03700 [Bacteroidetes bacterium]|nr:hypothetical protein [Bacteroidota bacterium]